MTTALMEQLELRHPFQNRQYFIRGVAKINFSEKVKNRICAMMAAYGQYGSNMAFQKL